MGSQFHAPASLPPDEEMYVDFRVSLEYPCRRSCTAKSVFVVTLPSGTDCSFSYSVLPSYFPCLKGQMAD
jgi:hypothetical protein